MSLFIGLPQRYSHYKIIDNKELSYSSVSALELLVKLDVSDLKVNELLLTKATHYMNNLQEFNLSNSTISGKFISHLTGQILPKLAYLNVNNCVKIGQALESLEYLVYYRHIKLECNNVIFKSITSASETQITFHNLLEKTVKVMWFNFDGALVLYRELKTGEFHTQPTYLTHPWCVYTKEGMELVGITMGIASGPLYVKVGENFPDSIFMKHQPVVPIQNPPNWNILEVVNFTNDVLLLSKIGMDENPNGDTIMVEANEGVVMLETYQTLPWEVRMMGDALPPVRFITPTSCWRMSILFAKDKLECSVR